MTAPTPPIWAERITADPAVLAGKPIVRGTRLAVEFILGLLGSGWSIAQLLEEYPGLTDQDVRACMAYAADRLGDDRVYPLAG